MHNNSIDWFLCEWSIGLKYANSCASVLVRIYWKGLDSISFCNTLQVFKGFLLQRKSIKPNDIYFWSGFSAGIYMFKSNHHHHRHHHHHPKLTIKTPKRRHWSHSGVLLLTLTNLTYCSGVYIVHLDQVSANWVSFMFFCPFRNSVRKNISKVKKKNVKIWCEVCWILARKTL